MFVTLKTLQQQTFKIEIGPEETVKVLKEKIEKEKGAETFPAGGQKLIYAGKILDDDKVVSTYKIEEKNFVVVMVTKPKSTPAVAPTAPSTETASSVPAPAAPHPEPVVDTPKTETESETESTYTPSMGTATPSESVSATSATSTETATTESSQSETSVTSEAGSSSSAESALVTGQQYEDVVSQMVNMGFPRDQVQRALRASFNNPDRAVEYLFNGIPDMPREEPPAPVPNPTSQPSGTAGTAGTAGTVSGTTEPATGSPVTPATQPASGTEQLVGPPAGSQLSGEDALAFLRSQPQFQHMRTLIQQNPQLLPELLQQIGRSNPQLLQMISQNQEQFISMLNEQDREGETAQGGGVGGAPGEGPLGSGGYIQVTQQEKEAIERLKALGFSEAMCIQAYFACEKNEELAANYLLSHGFDDDDS